MIHIIYKSSVSKNNYGQKYPSLPQILSQIKIENEFSHMLFQMTKSKKRWSRSVFEPIQKSFKESSKWRIAHTYNSQEASQFLSPILFLYLGKVTKNEVILPTCQFLWAQDLLLGKQFPADYDQLTSRRANLPPNTKSR